MDKLIVILDDEIDIVELVSIHLKKAGFNSRGFIYSKDFLEYIETVIPDLIILDLMLPDADGFEICRILRSKPDIKDIPVIMLTARADEIDKIVGLELGADDYITKPFSPKELMARVKAVLRRMRLKEDSDKIKIGTRITLDNKRFEVEIDGEKIDLTSTEFRILKILAEKKGWVFSRNQLLEKLWGNDKFVLDRTIDVHIKNLREKLGSEGKCIKNIRGIGYKLEK
ncbi:MAG: response regulator transcription factor [Candidatus Coatesbacteria bacterium]|nr:response regulator transcription factor [Candidatus Coatesbacteria bacterium]